jgi:SAM-dependent methyltransferase
MNVETALPSSRVWPACPICFDRHVSLIASVDERNMNLCAGCRHVFWEERAGAEEVASYYRKRYGGEHDQLSQQLANKAYYERHVDELVTLSNVGKDCAFFVDYGSSYPTFALTARERGVRRSVAVDWDGQARAYGAERGLTCLSPDSFEREVADGEVDLLRFSHVIEHMIDPVQTLRSIVSKLKQDGFVYITQPNFPIFSTAARGVAIKGAVWPEHLHFFSPLSLMMLCERLGLKPVRFFSHTAADETRRDLERFIDLDCSRSALKWLDKLGDRALGEAGNWPWFAGTNSVLLARKA